MNGHSQILALLHYFSSWQRAIGTNSLIQSRKIMIIQKTHTLRANVFRRVMRRAYKYLLKKKKIEILSFLLRCF